MAHLLFMVPVPEVEPYVSQLRERFDPSARRGLPAHITLLHAALPERRLDADDVSRARAALAPMAQFGFQVTKVARFPGTLYLGVEPRAPFERLHEALARAWPPGDPDRQRQPLVPHISVMRKFEGDDRPVEAELMLMLSRHGPIDCDCHEIGLLEDSSGSWRPLQQFALSAGRDSPSPAPS
jgi:2'-5' RNA ligase